MNSLPYSSYLLRSLSGFCLFILLHIGNPYLKAATTISINEKTRKENVLSHSYFFIDKSGSLSIEEILKVNFNPYRNKKIQYGFSNDALWFSFIVENKSTDSKHLFLELNYKELDYVDLYEIRNDTIFDSMFQGDMRLSNDLFENSFFPLFNIDLHAGEQRKYYLKIKSSSSLLFEAFIWDQISYFTYMNIHDKFLWFFIGFQFLRLMYVIIISRYIPQSYFKWYAYVILIMVFGILLNSINLKFYQLRPSLANQLILCIHYLLPLAILLWVRDFLKEQLEFSYPLKIIVALLYLQLAGICSTFFLFQKFWFVAFSYCFMLLTFFIIIALLSYLSLKNKKIERSFVIPIVFLIICNIPYSLIGLNILPYNQTMLIIIGSLVSTEVITMSILVGYLMKIYINKNIESVQQLVKMRDQISTDLHDELGSVLTQISLQSDLVKSGVYDENQKVEELDKISQISRKAIHSMSDFVWNVKPENDKWSSLLDRMRDHADIMLSINGIEVQFETKGISLTDTIDGNFRQEVFMIFKEAITNILKHGASNQVRIYISNDPSFYMSIKNDVNKVISDNKLGGNGLKHIKNRSSKIGLLMSVDKNQYSFELIVKLI